jgi:hypothetical protein
MYSEIEVLHNDEIFFTASEEYIRGSLTIFARFSRTTLELQFHRIDETVGETYVWQTLMSKRRI